MNEICRRKTEKYVREKENLIESTKQLLYEFEVSMV
jgi:hypothetical protein